MSVNYQVVQGYVKYGYGNVPDETGEAVMWQGTVEDADELTIKYLKKKHEADLFFALMNTEVTFYELQISEVDGSWRTIEMEVVLKPRPYRVQASVVHRLPQWNWSMYGERTIDKGESYDVESLTFELLNPDLPENTLCLMIQVPEGDSWITIKAFDVSREAEYQQYSIP